MHLMRANPDVQVIVVVVTVAAAAAITTIAVHRLWPAL